MNQKNKTMFFFQNPALILFSNKKVLCSSVNVFSQWVLKSLTYFLQFCFDGKTILLQADSSVLASKPSVVVPDGQGVHSASATTSLYLSGSHATQFPAVPP